MRCLLTLGLMLGLLGPLGCRRPQVIVVEQTPGPSPESVFLAEPEAPPAGEPFVFATDSAGHLLAKTLTPPDVPSFPTTARTEPLTRPGRASLERPGLPLTANQAEVVRVPLPAGPVVRPHDPPTGAPLDGVLLSAAAPTTTTLPTAALVRVPRPDPTVPAPLPILARPVADRGALGDTTRSFSAGSAVAAPPPLRSEALPYVRTSIPDPFENARSVKLPASSLPVEDPTIGLPVVLPERP
jgi:hypothetical protein